MVQLLGSVQFYSAICLGVAGMWLRKNWQITWQNAKSVEQAAQRSWLKI